MNIEEFKKLIDNDYNRILNKLFKLNEQINILNKNINTIKSKKGNKEEEYDVEEEDDDEEENTRKKRRLNDDFKNRCIICNVDMGYCNPRQYCKKTYCDKSFLINDQNIGEEEEGEDEEEDFFYLSD